ncbi:hypothetical protein FQZ97_1182750 [compost metagenome]
MHAGQGEYQRERTFGQAPGVGQGAEEVQHFARPAPTSRRRYLQPAQQSPIDPQQRPPTFHQRYSSHQHSEHQQRAARQHAFEASTQAVEQGIAGNPQHGAEKEQ